MASKPIYALVRDLFSAEKIVKAAKVVGLEARTFDSAEKLIRSSREREPALVVLDGGELEKEVFRVLGEFRSDERLSKVPALGYLSHASRTAEELKREMREAGCIQVYTKSEFTKELETLLARHAHGFPSRI